MNVDVEIYLSNLIKFFRENPKDLASLIPVIKEKEFFQQIREQAIENLNEGKEIVLTHKQLVQICVKLNNPKVKSEYFDPRVFVKFKDSFICLN